MTGGPRALAIALVLLAACRPAEKASERQRLVVAYSTGPSSLVPNAANEEVTISILGNVYESLVRLDAVLGLKPALAQSWETPDETTWVFRLRDGARFHDGRLVEAQDVVASLERTRINPSSAVGAYLTPVRRIEAPDRRTVIMRTDRSFEVLAARLTNVLISVDAPRAGDPPLGTGPYRVRSWTPGGTVVLEEFPRSGVRPAIPVVEFQAVPDVQERLRGLREGRFHVLVDVPAEEMASLGALPSLRTLTVTGLRVIFLAMDCAHERSPHVDTGVNPFRDVRVRRAVARAIDAEALVKGPLGGFGEVVDQIASPQEIGGRGSDIPARRYDLVEARSLLAAAGYPAGFTVSFDYFSKYRSIDAVVARLQEQLARVGIRIVPRTGTTAEVSGRIERRDTAFYLAGWVTDTGESGSSYEALLHTPVGGYGVYNGGGYSNAEVDRLAEASSRSHGHGARMALLNRLAAIVQEDVPVIPLYRQADLYAVSRQLDFKPRLDRRIFADEVRWRP